jgi:D-alanyl-D-alanine carboxypeptidase (penicillin-binding protein 5/6)
VSLVGRRALAALAGVAVVAAHVVLLGWAGAEVGPPPPTPVPPDGRPSPFPSVLATPADALAPPALGATAALLADLDRGQVLEGRAVDRPLPIASLTKIMTALLVLERADLDRVVEVDPRAVFGPRDYGATSTLGLRAGERLRVEDLLYGLLLGSANDAAEALAIHVAGDVDRFVALMNRRAQTLGMRRTRFASATGLDDRGRSTARDLLRLVRRAMSDPRFARIVATRRHRIPGPHGRDRIVQNRNVLLWLYEGATGVKTGYTAGAGACLVATAERDGRRLVAIVLGDRTEAFSAAAALLNHGFDGYTERTFVREGQPLGAVDLPTGTVPVVAGASVEGLVPTLRLEEVERRLVVTPPGTPPEPGAVVGTVRVEIPGRLLGSAPVVVAASSAPPPLGGTWWQRATAAVARAIAEVVVGFAR